VNAARRAVAGEILAASRAHDAGQADRLTRFRNVEPETAELLAVMIRSLRPRRVLELGTSNGYSTIWLADAVEAVHGSLTSVEIDPARAAIARTHLERAALHAELVTGDAADVLRAAAPLRQPEQDRQACAQRWNGVIMTTLQNPFSASIRLAG
jgi:predicted O-methyltransferase YrrM